MENIAIIGILVLAALNTGVCALAIWLASKARPDLNIMRMLQDAQDRLMAGSWTNYAGHVTGRPDVAGRVQDVPTSPAILTEDEILEQKPSDTADTVAHFD